MKTALRTILFDMDGTIIDTEPAAAKAIQDCFARWNIQIDLEDARFITGRTWAIAFDFLFKKYPIPVSAEVASEMMMAQYRETLDRELAIVPGSIEAVKDLSQHFQMALVSGSGRQEILWAMKKVGLMDCFKFILGAEDYSRSKPAPDGYLKAMKLLNAEPAETLIFEDSEAGIASACAAGVFVVAISSTNHFGHDTSRASLQIPDLKQVNHSWVKGLKNFRISE
ncbi:MAG: HAD family phosphatase [Methylotenera sp.]|nr:HAD family phosphatase [Oligoflexia bacterium]